MLAVAVQGIALGLSTGLFCLAYCAPVYVPLMMSENRGVGQSALVVGELALGRLVAYLTFGAAVGYLGRQLEEPFLQKMVGIAMVVLSASLLLYVATRGWPHLAVCRWVGRRHFQFPALFGFFTGINICPPFLLAISYAFGMASIAEGMLLFGGFFVGTSVYLVMLLPLGYLGRWHSLRVVSLMTASLSGVFFLVMGLVRVMAQ